MGKKGTKRKTRWRTLSIGEAGSDDEGESPKTNGANGYQRYHSANSFNNGGGGYHHHNPRYSSNGRGGGRSSFSSQSTPTRRHTSYQSHQHYLQNGAGTGGGRSHSTTSADAPKITFNEDEYTRITTPRQDVLFKKGYLSRRKPLVATPSVSSAEPGASTSAPSTPSTQSTSPEHHANASGEPEFAGEGEQVIPEGLMYPNGFFDQNGIFYVNTAIANFDGFGQMMMLPYGAYPPYGHIEYYNQVCLQHPYSHKGNSVDSQVSDTPETTSPQNEPVQSSQDDSGKASMKEENLADSETAQQSADSCGSNADLPPAEVAMIHNGGPHYIYPGYMFGSQMYHINGVNIQCGNAMTLGGPMDLSNKQKYKKKRRRKQRKPSGSTGTMATDYSEDEYSSDSEPASMSSQRASSGSSLMSNVNGNQEQWLQDGAHTEIMQNPTPVCDPLKSVLNTNCSEFVPKAQLLAQNSQLKTDVSEFIPQSHKTQANGLEQRTDKCPVTETPTVHEKIEVAIQTKEDSFQEIVPVTPKQRAQLTNGHEHKNEAKKPIEVLEPVRKVQIVCVERSAPAITSTPRDDQWTTVKSSKKKKGRQETNSVSPKSEKVAENSFQTFIDGAITPPPSEDEMEKQEEVMYFTTEDAIEHIIEETITEEANPESPKKSPKAVKSKAKKGKKVKEVKEVKEQVKPKPTQVKESSTDEKKTKSKTVEKANGKPKTGKQESKKIVTVVSKPDQPLCQGPIVSPIVEVSEIETSEEHVFDEPKLETHIELPEPEKPQVESIPEPEQEPEQEQEQKLVEMCKAAAPVITLTETTPIDESQEHLLPPTPNESTVETSENCVSMNEADVGLNETDMEMIENCVSINEEMPEPVISETETITTHDISTKEEVAIPVTIATDIKPLTTSRQLEDDLPSDSQLISDATDANTAVTVKLPSYDNLDSPDVSTFNSVPDITEDTPGVVKEVLSDEGVILSEGAKELENPLYLTEAVRRWLSEQKERSPEPVLREPDDPELAVLLRGHGEVVDGSGSSDQDTDDGEEGSNKQPKNLKGNPLRASSVKRKEDESRRAKRSRSTPPSTRHGRGQGETGDTDSDYLSDIQDDTRKRVAGITSEPDLLDCWEPDILPFSALPALSQQVAQQVATEQAEEVLETYESVYGKSVDYDKLSASLGARKPPVLPPLRGEGVAPPCSGICCSIM